MGRDLRDLDRGGYRPEPIPRDELITIDKFLIKIEKIRHADRDYKTILSSQ